MGRKLAALGAVAVALGVAVVALAYPAGAAEPDPRRGLTVSGTHVLNVAPDTAEWSFGVQARASGAGAAMRSASARMRGVVAAVRKTGVQRRDIRTDAMSLYPQTSEEGGMVTGYVASTTVAVAVRSLARAGAVVEAAVEAGAVEVYGPSLTRSDAEARYRDALDLAYDAARTKAERLAARVGVSLGAATAIVEGSPAQAGPYAEGAARAAGGEVAVEPGQTGIAATVTVTFAIA